MALHDHHNEYPDSSKGALTQVVTKRRNLKNTARIEKQYDKNREIQNQITTRKF